MSSNFNGATGVQGPKGATGPSGPIGCDGPTGVSGATGAVGPTGVIGVTGAGVTGATGVAGPAGTAGAAGALGPTGVTGPAGTAGTAGAAGSVGVTGATGPAGGSSSLFPSTVLQLHFDGVNASTVFTDAAGNTVTAIGNAQLSTTTPKIGTACGTFDGIGDKLTIPTSQNFDHSNIFTIEGWVRTTQISRQYATLYERDLGAFAIGSEAIVFNSATASDGKVSWYCASIDSVNAVLVSTSAINDGLWHHIAVVGVGGGMYLLFIDGALQAMKTNNTALAATTSEIKMGMSTYVTRDFSGQLDEWRIVKGTAAYVKAFTPSVAAFPDV